MGGKMSRDKGKRGEREFAAVCKEHGYEAHRTAQHMGKDGGEPDVVGLPGVHIEVKRCESLSLYKAREQAHRDAKVGLIPVVAHRRNGLPWVVIIDADDFFKMYNEYHKTLDVEDGDKDQTSG